MFHTTKVFNTNEKTTIQQGLQGLNEKTNTTKATLLLHKELQSIQATKSRRISKTQAICPQSHHSFLQTMQELMSNKFSTAQGVLTRRRVKSNNEVYQTRATKSYKCTQKYGGDGIM